MLRRMLVVSLLLGVPGVSLGQGVEKYFSPNSRFYLRWEGFAGHREAFDKTALGQTLKGDTGTFIGNLWKYVGDNLEPALMQVDRELASVAKEIPPALESIAENGFAVAIEASKFDPPEVQMVLVFPGGGGPKGKVSGLVKKMLQVSRLPTTTIRDNNMEMQKFSYPQLSLEAAFGSDGANAVLVLGNIDSANVMRRVKEKGAANIGSHPLYKEIKSFKEFHVWAQGFVDVAGLVKTTSDLSDEAAKLMDDLGLKGLKSITFHSGFDGPAERSVTDFHMPGPRKGLLNLAKGHKFSLKDLPPLPHDIRGFTASSLDATNLYDTLIQVSEGGVRVVSAEAADFIKEGIKQVELLINVKLRDDLLGSLGDLIVTYDSPSESPFLGLGSVTLIKVKDEKKLIETAEALQKFVGGAVQNIPGVDFEIKQRKYRGVDLVEVQIGPSFYTMTFALHKGWLVWSNYPQPVHGFILRTKGELPVFNLSTSMEGRMLKALAPFPKEFNSIAISDPAPGVQFALSLAPPLLSAMNGAAKQFLPGAKIKPFDVGSIPHPLEATRLLFPTITITTDNGKRLRFETRSSF